MDKTLLHVRASTSWSSSSMLSSSRSKPGQVQPEFGRAEHESTPNLFGASEHCSKRNQALSIRAKARSCQTQNGGWVSNEARWCWRHFQPLSQTMILRLETHCRSAPLHSEGSPMISLDDHANARLVFATCGARWLRVHSSLLVCRDLARCVQER